MTLEEVAAAVRRKPEGFRRTWRRLHDREGFPAPLRGLGLVWSRKLVEAWIEGRGAVRLPANDDAPADLSGVVAAQRAMLHELMVRR